MSSTGCHEKAEISTSLRVLSMNAHSSVWAVAAEKQLRKARIHPRTRIQRQRSIACFSDSRLKVVSTTPNLVVAQFCRVRFKPPFLPTLFLTPLSTAFILKYCSLENLRLWACFRGPSRYLRWARRFPMFIEIRELAQHPV